MTIQSKSRGQRMKLNGVSTASVPAAPAAGAAAGPAAPAIAAPLGAAAPALALESALLEPAQAALRALPEFDAARVAELRDALSKGELPFDAGRLAGLIQRFHGSQA
jgi:negative regulator of flagellin synthesis FlgM